MYNLHASKNIKVLFERERNEGLWRDKK